MSVRVERSTPSTAAARPSVRREPRPVDLHLERLRAPFSLRCGAVLIDYIALIAILAVATLLTRYFGEVRKGSTTLLFVSYPLIGAVAFLNRVVLPAWTGRSLGKWVTALRIERPDGMPLSIGRALLRHLVGYPLTCLTLGVGFLVAAFNSKGRALHDFLAGTVVVRTRGSRGAALE